jgi:hypothetical protein
MPPRGHRPQQVVRMALIAGFMFLPGNKRSHGRPPNLFLEMTCLFLERRWASGKDLATSRP